MSDVDAAKARLDAGIQQFARFEHSRFMIKVSDAEAISAELDRLREENDLLRGTSVTYDEDGNATWGWTPIDNGRLEELEAAEAELAALREKEGRDG